MKRGRTFASICHGRVLFCFCLTAIGDRTEIKQNNNIAVVSIMQTPHVDLTL